MRPVDIRPLKQRLREDIKRWRRGMSPQEKERLDERIFRRVVRLREYERCRLVLTYVSKPIEVDTLRLIAHALDNGKKVAVPRCVEGTRDMEFYLIRSMEDLAPQTFGVLEPIPEQCELVKDFHGSICIVPALAYDHEGYRLGYGAGYYDRFLSKYPGMKVGIVYQHNLRGCLWHGKYDVPVGLIATDNRLYVCSHSGSRKEPRKKKYSPRKGTRR